MEKLKFYREKAKMSQEELAKRSGISRVNISMIETGKREMKSSTLVQISNALKLDPRLLLPEVKQNEQEA